MSATLKAKKAGGFLTFLSYLLKILFVTATAMIVGGMNLTIGLLFAGLFSLLHLLFSKGQSGTFFAPNFLFIPLIYRTLSGLDAHIFPNDYTGAIGELVVAFWLAGIIHIVLAIIARYIPYQKLRRAFPPYLLGALNIVLAFSFLLLLGGEYLLVPFLEHTPFPYVEVISIIFTLIMAYFIKNKTQKGSIFREAYFFFALLSGAVFYFVIEAFEFLITLQDLPYLLRQFASDTPLNWSLITPFQDLFAMFGYFDRLRFNGNLALAIIPLTIIAFFELFEAVKNEKRLLLTGTLGVADYDRFLFANGLSLMFSSAAGIPPFYAQKVYDERLLQKEERQALFAAVVVIALLAIWQGFNNLFYLIPPSIYQALVIFSFLVIINHGYQMIKVSYLEQGDKKNIFIAVTVILFGGILAILTAVNTWTGLNIGVIAIGNIRLDPLLLTMVLGIILNIAIPRRKRKDEEKAQSHKMRVFHEQK